MVRGFVNGRTAALFSGAFFGHAIYPLAVLTLARLVGPRADLPVTDSPDPDSGMTERYVSVVVPAYREVSTIGRLTRHLLESPGTAVAEVIAVTDDDTDTAAAARAAGADVVEGAARGGKSGAVNRGVAQARHEVVILLDANVEITVDAVNRLCGHVASGRLDLAGGVRTEVGSAGEGMYWAFENATKAAEHRLGGSLAVVGEAIALRKAVFRPIPTWVRVDDMWLAVDFAGRGLRVSVDTTCVTSEPSARPRDQLERRIRVVEAQLELLAGSPRSFVRPSRQLLMLHGHKTWRTTGGAICQILLVGRALAAATRSPAAAAWAFVNLLSAADFVQASLRDQHLGRGRALAAQALGMPPVILCAALWRLARGRVSGRPGGEAAWTTIAR